MTPVGYFSAIQIAALVLAIISIFATIALLLFPWIKRNPRLKTGSRSEVEEGVGRLENLGLSNEQAKILNGVLKGRLDQSIIGITADGVDRQLFYDVLEHIATSQDSGVD